MLSPDGSFYHVCKDSGYLRRAEDGRNWKEVRWSDDFFNEDFKIRKAEPTMFDMSELEKAEENLKRCEDALKREDKNARSSKMWIRALTESLNEDEFRRKA